MQISNCHLFLQTGTNMKIEPNSPDYQNIFSFCSNSSWPSTKILPCLSSKEPSRIRPKTYSRFEFAGTALRKTVPSFHVFHKTPTIRRCVDTRLPYRHQLARPRWSNANRVPPTASLSASASRIRRIARSKLIYISLI